MGEAELQVDANRVDAREKSDESSVYIQMYSTMQGLQNKDLKYV